jgi:hypothetical protein
MALLQIVAGVALLVGTLASCAAVPLPPRPVAPQPPEESEYREPSCGGVIIDDPTPEKQRPALVSVIELYGVTCSFRADAAGRQGEVRVTLRMGDGGPSTEVTDTAGMPNDDDRRCAERAARKALKEVEVIPGTLAEPLTVYVGLGKAGPLLGEAAKLIAEWQAAVRSRPARKRFATRLPAEVVLDDDGCLAFPERPIFVDGIERWLAQLEMPLDTFWQPSTGRSGFSEGGLFVGLGPREALGARAYLIDDQTVLLYHRRVVSSDDQRLCLLNFDEKVRREVQARIDRRGACWVGDLRQTLLHARTDVPTGRRFKTVAAEPTRVCAIDDRGERICCGEPLPKPPAATDYSTTSGNAARTCAIGKDGSVGCDRPWPAPREPFRWEPQVLGIWSRF